MENPSFIGSKFIFSPGEKRYSSCDGIEDCIAKATRLHEKYPTFMAGFDFVGQEDVRPKLLGLAKHILTMPKNINLLLHAGETNWYGSVDENLVRHILNIDLDSLRFNFQFLINLLLILILID